MADEHRITVVVGLQPNNNRLQGRAGNKSVPRTFCPLCAPANMVVGGRGTGNLLSAGTQAAALFCSKPARKKSSSVIPNG